MAVRSSQQYSHPEQRTLQFLPKTLQGPPGAHLPSPRPQSRLLTAAEGRVWYGGTQGSQNPHRGHPMTSQPGVPSRGSNSTCQTQGGLTRTGREPQQGGRPLECSPLAQGPLGTMGRLWSSAFCPHSEIFPGASRGQTKLLAGCVLLCLWFGFLFYLEVLTECLAAHHWATVCDRRPVS